jgi:hypothetical protein
MKVKQISVFLENKKGRLYEALQVLGEANINIRALSIADTAEYGILRLIVSEPDRAKKVLQKVNFVVQENDVIAICVSDKPGGLSHVLNVLQQAEINVEYVYAFVQKKGEKAVVVLRTEKLDPAIKALEKAGVPVLKEKEVYGI